MHEELIQELKDRSQHWVDLPLWQAATLIESQALQIKELQELLRKLGYNGSD